jgi:uncharacterized membrane protein
MSLYDRTIVYNIGMRWKNETQQLSVTMEFYRAMEIVTDAYSEGFISARNYELAMEQIKRHMNKYLFMYPKTIVK